jgi:hypothetical protein
MLRNLKNIMYRSKILFYLGLLWKEKKSVALDLITSIDERALLKELRDNGIIVIPNFLTNGECDSFVKEIELYRDKGELFGSNDLRVFGIQKYSRIIDSLYSKREYIVRMGGYLLGEVPFFQTCMAGILSSTMRLEGSGGGWHRDSFSRQFKSLVYLSDVDEDNGPFFYIKKSHTLASIKKVFKILDRGLPANISRYSEKDITAILGDQNFEVTEFTAKKGTLVLFDPRGLHRGKKISKGVRYALTNYFIAPSYRMKGGGIESLNDNA